MPSSLLQTVLPVMVLLLEEVRSMPSSLLLLTLLPVMMLLFVVTLIPASSNSLPEFVTLNPSTVIPSAVNVTAFPCLPASTTG